MKIIKDYPPNYDKICQAIPGVVGNDNICFTYGDTVYSPSTDQFPDHLTEHESVHIRQQSEMGRDEWWNKYLKDKKFRSEQELEAYRIQYQFVYKNQGREDASMLMKQISADLSGDMYGNILTKKQARKEIMKK